MTVTVSVADVSGVREFGIAPPNLVYRDALRLGHHRRRLGCKPRPEVVRVCRYLESERVGLQEPPQREHHDAAVAGAFCIARSATSSLLVRGLVVANVPASEIVQCIGTDTETIQMFECIFWNVRSRRQAAGYIAICISQFAGSAEDAVPLRLAYLYGKDVFLQLLGVHKVDRQTEILISTLIAANARRRALIAARCPVSPANAHQVIRSYLQLCVAERKSQMHQSKIHRWREELKLKRRKLEARRRAFEERALRLAEREKAVTEREERCLRLIAEMKVLLQQHQPRDIAAPRLAALTRSRTVPEATSRVA